MRIGGGAGPSGGVIQDAWGFPLLNHAHRELHKSSHPKAVRLVHLGGRAAPEEALQSVQVFAFFYRLVFLLAGAAMTALRLDLATGAGEIRGVVPLRIRRISPVVAGRSTATT